jgi:hypothetical protein
MAATPIWGKPGASRGWPRGGGADGTRTRDLGVDSSALSQLSYGPLGTGPHSARAGDFSPRKQVSLLHQDNILDAYQDRTGHGFYRERPLATQCYLRESAAGRYGPSTPPSSPPALGIRRISPLSVPEPAVNRLCPSLLLRVTRALRCHV